MNSQTPADSIRACGLRATPQRIAIYTYLLEHRTHPSADDVYRGMQEQGLTYTRATVYNVLEALCEHHLAIRVRIDENEVRYDGYTTMHGHFRCKACGRILDFAIRCLVYEGLDDCRITEKGTYFEGYCPLCQSTGADSQSYITEKEK